MRFETTQWSVVIAAQDDDSRGRDALARLCQSYWFPVYAFVRRRGYAVEEAQDLTQEFFARMIEKRILRNVNAERGKFRTYLLAVLNHFLANEWDRATAQKRGGTRSFVSLNFPDAEERLTTEELEALSPEKLYERKWAFTLIERAMIRLEDDWVESGKHEVFEVLRRYIVSDEARTPYVETAKALGMSIGALKTAVHRLRRRYGELVREEVAETVARPEDVAGELRNLIEILGE